MFQNRKTLLAATASLALLSGPALAESHVTATENNMEQAEQNLENAAENVGQAAENTAEDAADMTENAAEATGNAAENAAEATENAAEEAAAATEEAAEETGDVIENAAAEASATSASLAQKIETEFGDLTGNPINDLLGTEIVTADGNDVGEVDNFAMQNGKLVALAGIGGFLGLGEHHVALDFSRLMYNAEDRHFVVDGYTQEELEALPQYDEDQVQIIEDDEMTLMQAAEASDM